MTLLHLAVLALLLASATNLALMIPGGFVEMRDFSAYPPLVLGAFNVFLTGLGLGSFALAYLVLRHDTGFGLAAFAGLGYAAVYLLDLGRIFPVSPQPMSRLLTRLEMLGTGLGFALSVAAAWAWRGGAEHKTGAALPSLPLPVLVVLALAGIGIIAFATRAAMRRK